MPRSACGWGSGDEPGTGGEARRAAMTGLGEQRLARAALTYLAEPADPALGALLAICEPAEILAATKADLLAVAVHRKHDLIVG